MYEHFFIKTEQEVHGLHAFAFPVVTVNDEHAKSRFKRKLSVKFKEGICVKLSLKL